jgi:hypothetical protein
MTHQSPTSGARRPDSDCPPTADRSGVVRLDRVLSSFEQLHVGELPPSSKQHLDAGRVVQRFLSGMLEQAAPHARLFLSTRTAYAPVGSALSYWNDGIWQAQRQLPEHVATPLAAQIHQLVLLSQPTGIDGVSHSVRVDVAGIGMRNFRMHVVSSSELIVSALGRNHGGQRVEIVDAELRRRRRRLFEQGTRALHLGDYATARSHLMNGADVGKGVGRTCDQIRSLVSLGECNALDGRLLDAERCYKAATAIIADCYTRVDYQLVSLYQRLARCAETRGDRMVTGMWNGRMMSLAKRFA